MTYTTSYTYNLAGEVVNMTYPSGRVVQHSGVYPEPVRRRRERRGNAIGRLSTVANTSPISINWVSSVAYNVASQVTGFTYGNGATSSFGYSADRHQLTSLSYTKGGTLLSLSYSYSQSGSNNGQIAGITDNVASGRTVTYTYDHLHRLKTAITNGGGGYNQWGLSWTYDRYGNRTAQTATHGSPPANTLSVSTSTNRITGLGAYTFYYDNNGNLTQDDLYKYKYDAENRLVELRNLSDTLLATYAYDGNSLRITKVVSGWRTWYIYAGTKLIGEFEDNASNTYSAGTTPGGTSQYTTELYQHSDHLTARLTTENSSQTANQQGHYPFGEEWYTSGQANPSVRRKFTTYMKDDEAATGKVNYAVFRQHSGRISRFHSPDAKGGRLWDPQSLNRYPYARNNGINLVDPIGRDYCSFLTEKRTPKTTEVAEPALGGGSEEVSVSEAFSASLPQTWANQTDCENAGGIWVTSDCTGEFCDYVGKGAGPGFGEVGGWVGAAEQFRNNVNSFLSFNSPAPNGTLNWIDPNTGNWIRPAAPPTPGLVGPASIDYTPSGPRPSVPWVGWLQRNIVGTRVPSAPSRAGVPTEIHTCSLVSEAAGVCSYSCSVRTPFSSTPFSTSLENLKEKCPASAGAVTSCPLSIELRGNVFEQQVTSCSQ